MVQKITVKRMVLKRLHSQCVNDC